MSSITRSARRPQDDESERLDDAVITRGGGAAAPRIHRRRSQRQRDNGTTGQRDNIAKLRPRRQPQVDCGTTRPRTFCAQPTSPPQRRCRPTCPRHPGNGTDQCASPRSPRVRRIPGSHRVTRPGKVLYIIVCAGGPAAGVGHLVTMAQNDGWTVQIVATPAAALDFIDVPKLVEQTGRPVRSQYHKPHEPKSPGPTPSSSRRRATTRSTRRNACVCTRSSGRAR